MAVTEQGRIVLYRHFEEEMGEEKAKTLMDHLLPVGWTDLATTAELEAMGQTLRLEIAELRIEMHKSFKSHTLALMGLMVTLQGITIATVRLI